MEREISLTIVADTNSAEAREVIAQLDSVTSLPQTVVTPALVRRIIPIRANPAIGVMFWSNDLQGMVADVEAFAAYIKGEAEIKAIAKEAQVYIPDALAASQPDVLLDAWDGNGINYIKGALVKYNGKIFRCVSSPSHTSQMDWKPDVSPSLWVHLNYRDGIRVIPDSISVTEAFNNGEKGWWGDVLFVSLVNDNVFTPDQFPNNWEEVTNDLEAE